MNGHDKTRNHNVIPSVCLCNLLICSDLIPTPEQKSREFQQILTSAYA